MSNPTNFSAPSDISRLRTTNYRPSKSLYTQVYDNNAFRLYMQRNGDELRKMQLEEFEKKMGVCQCEKQPDSIKQFDGSKTCHL